ncbi:hypothetical protein Pyn_28229 [Prunus yedoensis var. nudiflora]|uniref:Uncharacterized protein n=1 Tax=Prunus yedoensis var. nudiflora TaxID=2094558 RepID=A0A314XJW0_PRUYE|nr:hypothetical protein Pyn_28229 [Prunus yedoensis var. nudiflora]
MQQLFSCAAPPFLQLLQSSRRVRFGGEVKIISSVFLRETQQEGRFFLANRDQEGRFLLANSVVEYI